MWIQKQISDKQNKLITEVCWTIFYLSNRLKTVWVIGREIPAKVMSFISVSASARAVWWWQMLYKPVLYSVITKWDLFEFVWCGTAISFQTFCFWAERSPAINNLSPYMNLSRSTRLSMVLNIQIVKYLFCSRGAKICENFLALNSSAYWEGYGIDFTRTETWLEMSSFLFWKVLERIPIKLCRPWPNIHFHFSSLNCLQF